MDHQAPPSGSALVSFCSSILSIFSFLIANADPSQMMSLIAWTVGVLAGVVGISSGIMAIRYYYFATDNIRSNKPWPKDKAAYESYLAKEEERRRNADQNNESTK